MGIHRERVPVIRHDTPKFFRAPAVAGLQGDGDRHASHPNTNADTCRVQCSTEQPRPRHSHRYEDQTAQAHFYGERLFFAYQRDRAPAKVAIQAPSHRQFGEAPSLVRIFITPDRRH